MQQTKSKINMCEGPLLRNIILYTLPIIATGLLQLLFNAADLVVVGQYGSEASVPAVGATGALTNLIVNLFLGLSVGGGVTVAQGLGAKDDDQVHRAVHTALPVAFIGGAILTVVGLFGARYFLAWMDTPSSVIGLSTIYMQIYFCGMIPASIFNFSAAILRAAGDTRSPLIFLSLSGVVNVLLNLVFVIVLRMDVAGVALATTISQLLSAILVVRSLIKRTDACRFRPKEIHIDRASFYSMIRIGLPAGIQGSIFSISNVLIQSSVNSFGEIVMKGNTAAASIEGFVYVAMNAFHQSAMNFIGQNIGSRKYERVNRILVICLASVAVVGLALGVLSYVFATPLLSLYIPDNPEAIVYGIIRLSFIGLPYFLCGVMDVMTGAMRGMGASVAPMLISIIGVCGVRITWIYTIFRSEAFHSLQSLYLSYPVSWIITFIAQIICYFFIRRRMLADGRIG